MCDNFGQIARNFVTPDRGCQQTNAAFIDLAHRDTTRPGNSGCLRWTGRGVTGKMRRRHQKCDNLWEQLTTDDESPASSVIVLLQERSLISDDKVRAIAEGPAYSLMEEICATQLKNFNMSLSGVLRIRI